MNEGISTEANLSHASFFTFATYTVHCYCRVTEPFSNMRSQLRVLESNKVKRTPQNYIKELIIELASRFKNVIKKK